MRILYSAQFVLEKCKITINLSTKKESTVKDVTDSKQKTDECFLSFSGVRSKVLSI